MPRVKGSLGSISRHTLARPYKRLDLTAMVEPLVYASSRCEGRRTTSPLAVMIVVTWSRPIVGQALLLARLGPVELGDTFDDDTAEAQELQPGREYAEWQADEETKRGLDLVEAAFDEKLWWYGAPGRRTKHPSALGAAQRCWADTLTKLEPKEAC